MPDTKRGKNDLESGCDHGCAPRQRRSRRPAAETRREILSAADTLFRERGYQQVAMADVAAALGMSPANVFKHFHAKTALVDAIACTHVQEMMEGLKSVEMPREPQAKLLRIAEALLTSLLADVRDNRHLFEMIVLTADLELRAGDMYRATISAIFENIILEGVAAGEFFVRDPRHTASVVTTALAGVINPLSVSSEKPDVLYTRCRDVIELVNTALQNPLAK
ncbi:TetR/AcrR family transcriptional regulator [Allorhizobium terrae]|uniref:TetR/AcrR family transcriptional regulator n=1 Tax=Allorhizobium terrae TaxID=1848972 RepID=A0A4S3ZNK7_9HYPH|nr:TetR/AcrR family transcriptional regulator [Allorhizobium terrae]THF47024.1 TetR/AcrR family transcriptional regulator [Allorhizobium terrae]TWD48020.1 TetR family transcriptional regulator [Agrobacterium vitis]